MPSRKEYEMLFQLNAELGKSFDGTFNKAQQELLEMQKEIQSLSKTQSNIAAYQKQQTAVNNTANKLASLRQEYANIQREISETEGFSSSLENRLISKQRQIERTEQSLEKYKNQLNETGKALEDAGVDTAQLKSESARLATEIEDVKRQQDEAADAAQNFGNKGSQAVISVGEALAAAGIGAALKEIAEFFADCAEASIDFESAMTGVAKTTDFTDEELSDMSSAIRDMSTEIPSTAEEIASVAEAAGQLGIQKDALLDFTEVMTMLGTATNMSADEAAQLVKSQCAEANYTQRENQAAADGLHYADSTGTAPALVDYYIIDNGKGGALIAEIRVPPEAAEGHGARLRQSLDTLEVF